MSDKGVFAPPLQVPIPLRADFVALLIIPRDLTTAEAERIAEIVRTMGLPPRTTSAAQENSAATPAAAIEPQEAQP